MTDFQRSQVYGAENMLSQMLATGGRVEVAGSTLILPVERRFGNLDNVRDYVERLHILYGEGMPLPQVRERRGQRRAHYESGSHTIAIPVRDTWAMREVVVLHEYAHALTWRDDPLDPGHGPVFQDLLESLLAEVIGPEAGWLFRYHLMTGV